jgi:hypothetical protein
MFQQLVVFFRELSFVTGSINALCNTVTSNPQAVRPTGGCMLMQ